MQKRCKQTRKGHACSVFLCRMGYELIGLSARVV